MPEAGSSSAGASGATAAPGDGAGRPQFVIQRPAPGSIAVTEAPAGANLKFNFASTDAKISVQDVDVVITFPDAGRIVLPGFAFNLLSAGGEVAFTDRTESAQELFANVSDLTLLDNPDLRTISSSDEQDAGKNEATLPPPPPPPPPAPSASPARQEHVADFNQPPRDVEEQTSKVIPTHYTPPSAAGAPLTPVKTVINAVTLEQAAASDGGASAPGVELDITLLGVVKGQVAYLPGGGQEIRGAAAVAPAATDASFGVQQQTKFLAGSAQDDVIYALDPARTPSGSFERLIDVNARFSDPGVVATTVTITNLPAGFAINNAEQRGDDWVIRLSKSDPNHLQVELRYVLPFDGAPSAVSDFDLTFVFNATDSKGDAQVYTVSQNFVTREITSAADVVIAGPGGTPIYALNATPPGTEIFAGGGDDTVYAGPGRDTLDGGSGDNLLSYAQSASGVMVDLSTGQGRGGYAEGDILRNFTSLEGSEYADRLTGSADDNVFQPLGGADTIIGSGGRDAVDYSASPDGVSIDLVTGAGVGGFAAGNVLFGVSDIVGSIDGANRLLGSGGANRLVGGTAVDTIDGAGGADDIIAGSGADSVSFYATENAIDAGAGVDTLVMKNAAIIDLAAVDQTTGDAAVVSGFENIDASALTQGVALTGGADANSIDGGAGDDSIHGGGGRDAIDGAAGADRIDYNGSEVSIDGGAGDDTLVMLVQSRVDLAANDQTRDDTVAVSAFENVDASALGASQPVTIVGADSANQLVGGAGADHIDGAGGADIIDAGAGDDRVNYRGSENQIDGGVGINTLVLDAAVSVDLATVDQTVGDLVQVQRFVNVDASGLTNGVSIAGDLNANTLAGGAGDDTIDGGAGADIVTGNAGDDVLTLGPGTLTLDGGAGSDTLVIPASGGALQIDFSVAAGLDQTVGDAALVVNFESLGAAFAVSALNVRGSAGANSIATGSGGDTIDGGGGFDAIAAGAGDDSVSYRGSENAISGGGGTNDLVLLAATGVDLARADQTVGDSVDVSGFQNVDARALGPAQAVMLGGSATTNMIFGSAGNDTIDGVGGADAIAALWGDDRVVAYGSEAQIDAGAGSDTLVLSGSNSVSTVNFIVSSGADQTVGDVANVTGFEQLDASALTSGLTVVGALGADSIVTGAGADVIHGSGGADLIQAGAGNDVVDWWGTEAFIDGGADSNTLVMRSAGVINLDVADQTSGDLAVVANFQNIDASGLSLLQATSLTGNAGANQIEGGSGADSIDGAGGLDVIDAGAGADAVTYRGAESLIDGGSGGDVLIIGDASTLNAIDLSAAADQTIGDAVIVKGFETLDASSLGASLAVAGSGPANTLTTGDGDDTIDGAGGADVINAGAGADAVTYHGSEAAIDGGSGVNTLQLLTAVDIDLGRADQTFGDSVNVQRFQNIDASALSATQGVSVTGLVAANIITAGAGADTIDGAGGADMISGGDGSDSIAYYGAETSIDGGAGLNTLVMRAAAVVDLAVADQTIGDGLTQVTGFTHVDASALFAGASITASVGDNLLTGGAGADTIDGAGGADTVSANGGADTVFQRGAEIVIDGGLGNDMLVLTTTSGVTSADLAVGAGLDQTTGDLVLVTGFENIDAGAISAAIDLKGSAAINSLTGGAGADTIDGRGGADLIYGGAGDDIATMRGGEAIIDGGANQDTLILVSPGVVAVNFSVAAGVDQTLGDPGLVANFENLDAQSLGVALTVTGSSGVNVIATGAGADTIEGNGGADAVNAGAGDDCVSAWGDESVIDGGDGIDTLVLRSPTQIDLALADQTLGDIAAVTGFANVDASALTTTQSVSISGAAGVNVIASGDGADTIDGRAGADVISAGAGDDTVSYYDSGGAIDGGADTDTLILKAAVTVNLANADQTTGDSVTVTGFENIDASLIASALTLWGDSTANSIMGGSGDDTIDGAGGGDTIVAGGGADRVIYYGSDVSVDGGAATDNLVLGAATAAITINLASATDQTSGDTVTVTNFENIDASGMTAAVTLTGSTGADSIQTGSGADTIDGGGGADTIASGGGNDTVAYYAASGSLDGGLGTDTLALKQAVAVNLANVADQTTDDFVTVSGFENIDATAIAATALTLSGDSNANAITGGGGGDTIDGAGGGDTISAGDGVDRVIYYATDSSIDGGANTDTLTLGASIAALTVDLASATDQTSGDSVTVRNFEHLDASAMTAAVTVSGSSGGESIQTGSGADTIDGAGGGDTIVAGAGADRVIYYATDSLIDGDAATDTLVLGVSIAAITVNLTSATDQTSGDSVTVKNFEHLDASAMTAAVTVSGSSGAQNIQTGSGADTIDGGGGADTIAAAAGNDTVSYYSASAGAIDGGANTDTLVLKAAVMVNLVNADQTSGDTVTVSNFENIDASGLATGASLTGASTANSVTGGDGDDTIDGAGGGDTISAGSGADRVIYYATDASVDGGAASDTLVLGASIAAITVNLASAIDETSGDSVTVQNFENIDASGMTSAVSVTGTSDANLVQTGSGADTIDGAGGADTIAAGGGNDTVAYYNASGTLDGGLATDTLALKQAATVNLAAVADQTTGDSVTVAGFENIDATAIAATALTLSGDSNANAITGGGGGDTIDGGTGVDTISGSGGDDTIHYYGVAGSALDGGAGINTLVMKAASNVDLRSATDQTTADSVAVVNFTNVDASAVSTGIRIISSIANNIISGTKGQDWLDGISGADIIYGNEGNDQVDYRGGEVLADGGIGTDTLRLYYSYNVTKADLSSVTDQTFGDVGQVINFESVIVVGTWNVTLIGSSGANVITGAAGNETIDGNGGADTISAAAGNDVVSYYSASAGTIDGGANTDMLLLKAAATVNLANADQTTGDTVTVNNFENIDATALATGVSLTGSSSVNSITGGSGADTIDGAGGGDTLVAGDSADRVAYYATDVSVDGGAASDTLVLGASTAAITINLASAADETSGDSVTVRNFENLDASVMTAAVTVTGSSDGESIQTGSGTDTIDGAGGADTIVMGAGNDTVTYYNASGTFDGGANSDTLLLTIATTVNLANADQTTGDLANVLGFENVNASTLSSALSLTGDSNANTITSGSGDDTIDGGTGVDAVSGSGGNDSISYYGVAGSALDGGAGSNTLVLKVAATVNLNSADQTTNADSVTVANFINIDASALATGVNIIGTTATNVIYGGGGADTIDGLIGADVIYGNDGNDRLFYRGTETLVDGGLATDLLWLLSSASAVTKIDLSRTGVDQTDGDTADVRNFESVTGPTWSITIIGSSGANSITTSGGADTIDGGGGADVIGAGAGNDTIAYYNTASSLDGGADTDTLVLKAAATVNLGNADQTTGDTVSVANFENIDATALATGVSLTGSSGANVITAGGGADTIDGGLGNDTIDGGVGVDSIYGGGGDDTINYYLVGTGLYDGGTGTNTLVLKSAAFVYLYNTDQTPNDSANVTNFSNIDASSITNSLILRGNSGANLIYGANGSPGHDTIDGYGGVDTIYGLGGNDNITYYGDAGSLLDGGAGADWLTLKATATVILANADQTTGDTVTVNNFENIDATALATGVSLTGSSSPNSITGGSGNDTIDGGAGADTLSGGSGNDTIDYYTTASSLDGGANTDTLSLKAAATVNLENADQTTGDTVTVANFENIDATALTTGISLTGDANANSITGGSGADTIDGAAGADTIIGNAGNDTIAYYATATSLDGGADADTLLLKAAVTVNLANADQTTGDAVTVANFENINAMALATGVSLTGSSGDNTITGGTGADTIDGGLGNDTIDGYGGADSINANDGNDTISYYAAATTIAGGLGTDTLALTQAATVNLTNADQTTGDTVNVSDFENIDASAILATGLTLTGSSGANNITGGSGNDTIDGGAGADSINGGGGDDTIYLRTGVATTIDGGAGTNTLIVYFGNWFDANAVADQTTASYDSTIVKNFAAVTYAGNSWYVFYGSSGAETFTGGNSAGGDFVDGRGGADVLYGNGGGDNIYYYGSEILLDGGAATDMLTLKTAVTVNLANADQTSGDTVTVNNFEQVNGSGLATALSLTGSTVANSITGGSGNDTIDGADGADAIVGGGGNDTIAYYSAASSIDGGANTDTLVLKNAATVNLANADQTSGDTVTVSNFENINATGLATGVSLTGSASANAMTGSSGDDTITGGGGADTLSGAGGDDAFLIDVSSLKLPSLIDGGGGNDTLTLSGTGSVSGANLLASLSNIETIDFTAAGVDANLTLSGAEIAQIDGGAASTLTLKINAGDSFALTDPAANYDRIDSGATSSYTIYNDALHTTVVAQLDVITY